MSSSQTDKVDPNLNMDTKVDKTLIRIVIGAAFAGLMSALDATIVNVAQQTFIHEFNSHASTVSWVITAYALAMAAVIPVVGWASDRIGIKNWFILALTVFVIGSVICTLAQNIWQLIVFRAIQGMGGGMLLPAGSIIVTKAAGPKRLPRVMPFLGIPVLIGPIFGPIIGGQIIDHISWRWIFLVNLPIGIIAIIYGFIVLPKDQPRKDLTNEPFDFIGLLLLSPGITLFLYGVSTVANEENLLSPKIVIPIIVGLILISLFVWNSLGRKFPLVNLRVFTNKQYRFSVITFFLFLVGFFGSIILYPLYFQLIRGESPSMAGVLLAPSGIGAVITIIISGKLSIKYGSKPFIVLGGIITLINYLAMQFVEQSTSYFFVLTVLFIQGLGSGLIMMQLFTMAIQTLPSQVVPRATTLINIIQQIAVATGTAAMTMLWTRLLPDKGAFYKTRIPESMVPEGMRANFIAERTHQNDLAMVSMNHTFWLTIFLITVSTIIAAIFLENNVSTSSKRVAETTAS